MGWATSYASLFFLLLAGSCTTLGTLAPDARSDCSDKESCPQGQTCCDGSCQDDCGADGLSSGTVPVTRIVTPPPDASEDSHARIPDEVEETVTDSGAASEFVQPFELWFSLFNTFQANAARTKKSKEIIDRASAAGYTGMALLISSPMARASAPRSPIKSSYWKHLHEVLDHAAAQDIRIAVGIFPFSRSGGILLANPDLAEASPVRNVRMRVSADGTHAELVARETSMLNGEFEGFAVNDQSGVFRCFNGWTCWDLPGQMTFADTQESRPRGNGNVSARLQRHDDSRIQARLRQIFTVRPWTLYHVSYWAKAEAQVNGTPVTGKLAQPHADLYGWNEATGKRLGLRGNRRPPASASWKQYHTTVNSGDNSALEIILSTGIGTQGSVWFDDVEIREVAFVNLVRGSGGPLQVRSVGESVTYVEGVDFDPLFDPSVVEGPAGRARGVFDLYHPPPVLTIPSSGSSSLLPGQEFLVDYYAIVPRDAGSYTQVSATLCGPEIEAWMRDNIAAVNPRLPNIAGYFLAYDEIRHMNTGAQCEALNLDAAEVLATHLRLATKIVRAVRPDAELYIWSDMFDPFHNARNDYYQVEGDLTGSWEGVLPDLTIVNWGMSRRNPDGSPADLADSIRWFAGLGQRQILAGYYDSGDGADAATRWLDKAQQSEATNIAGLMYTAWSGTPDEMFSELEDFAQATWTHPFVTGGKEPPPSTNPPSVPTGLSAKSVSPYEVKLAWAASTDDRAVAGYRVFRDGQAIATTPTTAYTDSYLTPHTQYVYTVAALDAFQNFSEESASAAATTAEEPR